MKKEELIKYLGEKKLFVNYSEHSKGLYIELENKEEFFEIDCFERNHAYEVRIECSSAMEMDVKDIRLILHYVKELKNDKPFLVYFQVSNLSDYWRKVVINMLQEENYQEVSELQKKVDKMKETNSIGLMVDYYKKEDKKAIEKHVHVFEELEKEIDYLFQQKALFDYSKDREFFQVKLGSYACKVAIESQNGEVRLCIFEIEGKVTSWKISKNEEIKHHLQLFFDDKENKQRVRYLLNPSTYFFDKYCAKNEIKDKEEKETFYQTLLSHYTWMEIEETLAPLYKKKEMNVNETKEKGIFICDCGNRVYVFDRYSESMALLEKDEQVEKQIETFIEKTVDEK